MVSLLWGIVVVRSKKMIEYTQKFNKGFDFIINNEGGYVNDKNDNGGATKYGISQRSYPHVNIKNLTIEDAKKIYYCDYWLKGKIEQIPDEKVAIKVFDFSVNLGIRASVIVLQRALRSVGMKVQEDGLMGPQTISATVSSEAPILLTALKSEAAGYYRIIVAKNPSQQKFLNGWLNRAYSQIN